jgi:ribosome-binding protein aMBF1 (putative translation factor)
MHVAIKYTRSESAPPVWFPTLQADADFRLWYDGSHIVPACENPGDDAMAKKRSPRNKRPAQPRKPAPRRVGAKKSAVRGAIKRSRTTVRAAITPLSPKDETFRTLVSFRVERERQGLSLADIADRTGIDRGMLSRFENGKVPNPTLRTLKRYAEALGMRLIWRLEKGNVR